MSKLVYVDDITWGQENIPISFFNDLNSETLSQVWQYTSVSIPGSGYEKGDFETSFEGCQCVNKCFEGGCLCINRYGGAYSEKSAILSTVISENKPVVECSPNCTCSESCNHRVVQNGINLKMQVFKTVKKGSALRTLEFIPKFTFVCEYAGEVIGKAEACRRAQSQSIDECNYIYVLREHGLHDILETIVDPTVMGNVGRFLNHSCSPNLIPIPVRSVNIVPRVCMFAARDITEGEELTYDYSGGSAGIQNTINTNFPMKYCYCDSNNCRRFLPFDQTLLQA